MNLEDEMYRVMADLSAGDVPVDFKGAMVLHAFLRRRLLDYRKQLSGKQSHAQYLPRQSA